MGGEVQKGHIMVFELYIIVVKHHSGNVPAAHMLNHRASSPGIACSKTRALGVRDLRIIGF